MPATFYIIYSKDQEEPINIPNMKNQIIIPLFPVEVVLFPDLPLPLHIFEERYKIMIADCLQHNLDFGVVYSRNNIIKDVGCTARIVQVNKKYEDGRMDILVQGNYRFKIEEILKDKTYLQSRVTYIDDLDGWDEMNIQTLVNTGVLLLEDLEQIAVNRQDMKFVRGLSHKVVSFILAGISGFSLDQKQQILEMTSTAERLRLGIEQLQQIVAQARMVTRVEKENQDLKTFKGFSVN
jgi:Lon protease-like protein